MTEIGSAILASLQPALKPETAAVPTKAAAPEAVANFDAAMQHGAAGGQQASVVSPTEDLQGIAPDQAIAPVDAPKSPGDAILGAMQKMSGDFRNSTEGVAKSLEAMSTGGPANAAELMKLQFAMTQISVQQDITGKVVGKATQSLDTFLKNQ